LLKSANRVNPQQQGLKVGLPVGDYNVVILQQISYVLLEGRCSLFSLHIVTLRMSKTGEQVCEGDGDGGLS